MNLELTKEELIIIKRLVKEERVQLGALNFESTTKEYEDLKVIAPLNYKLKEI